jgi:hypothetical protein
MVARLVNKSPNTKIIGRVQNGPALGPNVPSPQPTILRSLYCYPPMYARMPTQSLPSTFYKNVVARMGEGRNVYRVWWESPKEKDYLKDQGVDGRMGSKWTSRRLIGGRGVDSPGSVQGSLAGCCECGDEPSGSGATELVS